MSDGFPLDNQESGTQEVVQPEPQAGEGEQIAAEGQAPIEPQESIEAEAATQAEPAPSEEPKFVPLADHQKQRELKREARQEAQNLRLEIARLQGRAEVAAPKPAVAEVDDEQFFTDPRAATEQMIQSGGYMTREEVQQINIDNSVYRAQAAHEDYLDMEELFVEAARGDKSLYDKMRSHPDPAEFAYRYGQLQSQAKQHGGDLTKMRESIAAEERVKLEAEFAKKYAVNTSESAPKTQAGATGSATTAKIVDDSLDAMTKTKGI